MAHRRQGLRRVLPNLARSLPNQRWPVGLPDRDVRLSRSRVHSTFEVVPSRACPCRGVVLRYRAVGPGEEGTIVRPGDVDEHGTTV